MARKRQPYNPLLKSYPDSDKVNAVSIGAETLFTRLIAHCDDRGCHYGEPRLLLAQLYAKRWAAGQVREKDVAAWLCELIAEHLVRIYNVVSDPQTPEGRTYLQIVNCRKDLRTDIAQDLRFPQPPVGQGVPERGTDTGRRRAAPGTESGHQPNLTQPNLTQPNPTFTSETAAGGKAEAKAVMAYWNKHRGNPSVRNLTTGRRAKLQTRLAEPAFADNWQDAIDRIGKAPVGCFLNGGGDRAWRADFDWFIRDGTNYVRVLEGFGQEAPGSGAPGDRQDNPARVRAKNGRYDNIGRILE